MSGNDRVIVLDGGPQPYCMTNAEARRALSEAHARRMAREAAAMARACADHLASLPEAMRCRPLRRDPLVLMAEEGLLTRKHVEAGREIAAVFQAMTAEVAPRVQTYGERLPRSPAEELPLRLRLAYANRYAPWREWAGARAATGRASLADLALMVCVDGCGPRQVADLLRMDQRTVKVRLRESLHGYCRIAGWLAPAETGLDCYHVSAP